MAFLSQRMITQIIVIVSPIAVITLSVYFSFDEWTVLGEIAGGMLVAILLTKGRYLPVLKDHVDRIVLHMRYGQQDRFAKEFLSPVQIAKANPWLLLALGILPLQQTPSELLLLPLAYTYGILVLSFLWVIGNSINHIYFLSPLTALLVAAGVPLTLSIVAILIVFAVLCSVLIIREFRVVAARRIKADWLKCFQYIVDSGLSGRTMVLPQISFPPLIYYTPLVMVASGHGSKAISYDRLTLKKNINDPLFLVRFFRKNNIRYLIIDQQKIQNSDTISQVRDGANLVEQYRNASIAVFEARNS